MFPNILVVVVTVVGSIRSVASGVEWVVVSRSLMVATIVLGRGLREPIVVPSVAGRSRHAIRVWGAIAGIRRCQWSTPGVVRPGHVARAIVVLMALDGLVTLVLGNLVLDVAGVGRVAVATVPRKLRIKNGYKRRKSLPASLDLSLLHVVPLAPVVQPGLIVLAQIEVDVESPVHSLEPIKLERVEL